MSGAGSFFINTPAYFRDYRQEYYILSHNKEMEYLKWIFAGLIVFAIGIL